MTGQQEIYVIKGINRIEALRSRGWSIDILCFPGGHKIQAWPPDESKEIEVDANEISELFKKFMRKAN